MIWRLLKRNISAWQIGGYAVATLVGLIIVMSAVQFYCDLGQALTGRGKDGVQLISPRNLVISKPVGLTNTLSGTTPGFSADDIEEIEEQPWCSGVSRFGAADFNIHAGVDFQGRGLTTALFFESVPERLVDQSIEGFTFDPADPVIPIVMSRDYLALYNFGFASSAGMPVISEGLVSSVTLRVTLSGNGRYDTYNAYIVGFSSWLNTIAVPESFMNWAHEIYGNGDTPRPSRLIIEVSDPADPAVKAFMDEHDYQIAGPDDDLGKAAYLLKLVTTVIVSVGGIITLLALFILILSLFLLIQKNRRSISGLLLLGYTPGQVAAGYYRLTGIVNAAVLVLAAAAMLALERVWSPAVEALGAETTTPLASIGVGAGLMFAITVVNFLIIRRLVRKCF